MLAEEINDYLHRFYADTDNEMLASRLGISKATLRLKASNLGLKKTPAYLKQMYQKLAVAKKLKQEETRKEYNLTPVQENILIGSLLGDGSLDLSGRSTNARYREHGSEQQLPYRQWKYERLKSQDFKLSKKGVLTSPSHPIYTKLYNNFYDYGMKIITTDNISKLSNPYGLATLYMDDGSLVINTSNKYKYPYIYPTLSIYSLCFTKDENIILQKHISKRFGVEFSLKKHPHGKGYLLHLGKMTEILKFIEIVEPVVKEVPCMVYKVSLEERLKQKEAELLLKGIEKVNYCSLNSTSSYYTEEEIIKMLTLKNQGYSYKEIANTLGRSYWSVYDRYRRTTGTR